jgi:hypothetical protein
VFVSVGARQVRLEEFGESYYNGMIPGVIEELQSGGHLQEDQGALIMFCGGNHKIPLMVRKSDGGYGSVRAARHGPKRKDSGSNMCQRKII